MFLLFRCKRQGKFLTHPSSLFARLRMQEEGSALQQDAAHSIPASVLSSQQNVARSLQPLVKMSIFSLHPGLFTFSPFSPMHLQTTLVKVNICGRDGWQL